MSKPDLSKTTPDSSEKVVWTKQITEDLILLYQNNPVLYCVYLDEYKNKNKRLDALNNIQQELLANNAAAAVQKLTVTAIKNKIHNLRTQFFKEVGKVKSSESSGCGTSEVYTPKLWCYEQLKFLLDTEVTRESVSNISEVPDDLEEPELIFDGTMGELNASDIVSPTPSTSSRTPTLKKRKASPHPQAAVVDLITSATNALTTKLQSRAKPDERPDHFTTFSRMVEEEMRKVTNPEALRELKKQIFILILDAQDV